MALGDNTLQSARGANANPGRKPYMVQTVLNLATALSDKGGPCSSRRCSCHCSQKEP